MNFYALVLVGMIFNAHVAMADQDVFTDPPLDENLTEVVVDDLIDDDEAKPEDDKGQLKIVEADEHQQESAEISPDQSVLPKTDEPEMGQSKQEQDSVATQEATPEIQQELDKIGDSIEEKKVETAQKVEEKSSSLADEQKVEKMTTTTPEPVIEDQMKQPAKVLKVKADPPTKKKSKKLGKLEKAAVKKVKKKTKKRVKGGMKKTKSACRVQKEPKSKSAVYNTVKANKKLWTEVHSAEYLKVYTKRGPAFVSTTCFE